MRLALCKARDVTGVIDSRLPRCSSTMPASAGSARNSASVMNGVFSHSVTSTLNQRGASRVALASKYGLLRSNCVASGYAFWVISTMPAMPGCGQLEW